MNTFRNPSRGNIISTVRVYTTNEGELVAAGDNRAARLFAIPGQKVALEHLDNLANAERFFPELARREAPAVKEKKRGPGRPRKDEQIEE